MERLPLFPLNTVLFPRMPLPLHIFEERYRLMIAGCVEQRAPFGVVLIRSGEEVGAAAEPHDVGTAAYIARVQRLPDGRLNIVVVGRRRFRIVRLDYSEPYLSGDVELLESEDLDTNEARECASRVAALFGEQFRLSLAVTGQWAHAVGLPDAPDRLADFVAAQLEVPQLVKQRLLEELPTPERLRQEEDMLGDKIRELTERWEERRQRKFAGTALN